MNLEPPAPTAEAEILHVEVPEGDALVATGPLSCTPAEIERWNGEWIEYLKTEWPFQLKPYTEFSRDVPLPGSAGELLKLSLSPGWELALYCDPEDLAGRRVMELGCGCGNLGKLAGIYAASYLGTDKSTLALAVARLVSPPNCRYVHVADHAALAPFHGAIDTVIGRYFWIHQNLALAKANLDFIELFLRPGGKLYCDFCWPAPGSQHFMVLAPSSPLSRQFPSAMFRYTADDVAELFAGRPFRLVREEISAATERRYVVAERI